MLPFLRASIRSASGAARMYIAALILIYLACGYALLLWCAKRDFLDLKHRTNPAALLLALFLICGWFLVIVYYLLIALVVTPCRVLSTKP